MTALHLRYLFLDGNYLGYYKGNIGDYKMDKYECIKTKAPKHKIKI
jgi:hypothetical protein